MEKHSNEPAASGSKIENKEMVIEEHHLLSCPNCNHFVSAIDINIDKAIAKCHNCNQLFKITGDLMGKIKQLDFPEPGALIPDGLEVLRLSEELEIDVNWRRAASRSGIRFLMFFTAVWNLILLPFILVAIFTGEFQILLFTSLHLAVGLGLIYYLARIFLNTTKVIVNRSGIVLSTGPLRAPWSKPKRISRSDIRQLYVSKYKSSTTNGRPNYAYALYVILHNTQKIKLLSQMSLETQLYLEQEIERFLGIRDVRVSGEVPKTRG